MEVAVDNKVNMTLDQLIAMRSDKGTSKRMTKKFYKRKNNVKSETSQSSLSVKNASLSVKNASRKRQELMNKKRGLTSKEDKKVGMNHHVNDKKQQLARKTHEQDGRQGKRILFKRKKNTLSKLSKSVNHRHPNFPRSKPKHVDHSKKPSTVFVAPSQMKITIDVESAKRGQIPIRPVKQPISKKPIKRNGIVAAAKKTSLSNQKKGYTTRRINSHPSKHNHPTKRTKPTNPRKSIRQ